jgi:hypothetical protein
MNATSKWFVRIAATEFVSRCKTAEPCGVSSALENRADLRLAGKLPALDRSL